MEYYVHYSPQYDKKYPLKHNNGISKRAKILVAVVVMAVCLVGIKHNDTLQRLLIPLGSDDSQQAVAAFVEDVKSGKKFEDAAANFCREILRNAKVEYQDPV